MGGPAVIEQTDKDGEPIYVAREIDALYHDRDGKSYPASIVKEYEVPVQMGEGQHAQKRTRAVADLRVNFGKSPKKPDWKSVDGVGLQKNLFNQYNKPHYERVEKKAAPAKSEK